jgi:hypothetical protein
MNAERWALVLILTVVLAVAASVGRSSGGDVAISGKLKHNALLQVGTDPPEPYEVSTLRYIVEAPPSTVGVVVPLDVEIMESLCRDKDGCQVTLQMVNAQPLEPGQVESESSWLFLSELSRFFRYAGRFLEGHHHISGEDDFGPSYLTTADWRVSDCILTPAESVIGSEPNERSDDKVGFGLLNCANTGLPESGGFECLAPDDTTTCRVVFLD